MFHIAQRLADALRSSRLACDGVRIDADWRERPRTELDDVAKCIRGGMGASSA